MKKYKKKIDFQTCPIPSYYLLMLSDIKHIVALRGMSFKYVDITIKVVFDTYYDDMILINSLEHNQRYLIEF